MHACVCRRGVKIRVCVSVQDTAVGREVLRVSATDPDAGHDGLVTYMPVSEPWNPGVRSLV